VFSCFAGPASGRTGFGRTGFRGGYSRSASQYGIRRWNDLQGFGHPWPGVRTGGTFLVCTLFCWG